MAINYEDIKKIFDKFGRKALEDDVFHALTYGSMVRDMANNPAVNKSLGQTFDGSHTHVMPTATQVAQAAQMAQAPGVPMPGKRSWRPMEMLAMRMGWDRSSFEYGDTVTNPFRHLSIAEDHEGAMLVWIVTDKGNVVLKDDSGLYPSDSLIAKIKTLV